MWSCTRVLAFIVFLSNWFSNFLLSLACLVPSLLVYFATYHALIVTTVSWRETLKIEQIEYMRCRGVEWVSGLIDFDLVAIVVY